MGDETPFNGEAQDELDGKDWPGKPAKPYSSPRLIVHGRIEEITKESNCPDGQGCGSG